MIITALFTFFTLTLLFPLMLVFMQGPSVSAELAMGTALALGGLYVTRQMKELRRVVPYLACMFVYIASAYYWKDHDNDLTAKYTLGLICYLVPAGLLLREFSDRGRGDAVLLGVAIFTLCLAAAGLEVLRTVGVENLVKEVGINLSRSNIENTSYIYLHFFTITNVLIGMSTFGICALAGIVVLSLDAPILLKLVASIAFSMALYANIQVLTRGAVVSAALGIMGTLPWVAVSMGPRRVVRYSAVGLGIVGCLMVYAVLANRAILENARVLVQRISETGDDMRLTHWNEAIGIIQRNIFGGGRGFMQTHTWAHNLFLDTALTAGLPGFLSMCLCVFMASIHILRVLLRGRRALHAVFLVLLSQFLAVFVLSMTSPPSLPLFGFILLVAGFFARPFRPSDQGIA